MAYSDGDELVMLQREMSFAGLKDSRNSSARSGVMPFSFTDWLLGDMIVAEIMILINLLYLLIVVQ